MINNRQAGRRRGRGGGGNGQRQGGNPGRPDNGNRIDSRARGNANQLYEKYKNLASDAQRQGDRVNTEYYLQFADHYFRVLSETRSRFDEQQPRRGRDDNYVNGFDNDFDGEDEFGDEGEPIRANEQAGEPQRRDRDDDRPRGRDAQDGGRRDDARRDDGRREEGQRGEPRRQDQRRNAVPNGGGDAAQDEPRRFEPRRNGVNGQGDAAPEREPRPFVPAVANDVDAGDPDANGEGPAVRRRGRPRRERPAGDDAPAAIEVDRLPPALSAGGGGSGDSAPAEPVAEPKPRRRRAAAATGGDAAGSGDPA